MVLSSKLPGVRRRTQYNPCRLVGENSGLIVGELSKDGGKTMSRWNRSCIYRMSSLAYSYQYYTSEPVLIVLLASNICASKPNCHLPSRVLYSELWSWQYPGLPNSSKNYSALESSFAPCSQLTHLDLHDELVDHNVENIPRYVSSLRHVAWRGFRLKMFFVQVADTGT